MDLRFSTLNKDFAHLNNQLFASLRTIVSSISSDRSNDVEVYLISGCGSVRYEVSAEDIGEGSIQDLFDLIRSDPDLLAHIADVQFRHFSKSELYRALCCDVVYPIQVLSGYEPEGVNGHSGISVGPAAAYIHSIRHDDDRGRVSINIQCGAPYSDFDRGLGPCENPDEFTLPEFIDAIIPYFVTDTAAFSLSGEELTAEDLRSVNRPSFPPPTYPRELLQLHRLVGGAYGFAY